MSKLYKEKGEGRRGLLYNKEENQSSVWRKRALLSEIIREDLVSRKMTF